MRMKTMAPFWATILICLTPASFAWADVKLPAVFQDHMVVQRQARVRVWGSADAGEHVKVTLHQGGAATTAGKDGRWSVRLPIQSAGGPYKLTIQGKNRVTIENVLIGEVWLCSGQSNMAMTVSRSLNFESEAAAADYPKIRMFTTERASSAAPKTDCAGAWAVCSPKTVGGFSATAYFFGRKLHQDLKVPVGLLHSSWGGTAVEAWTSMPAQKYLPELRPMLRMGRRRRNAIRRASQHRRAMR